MRGRQGRWLPSRRRWTRSYEPRRRAMLELTGGNKSEAARRLGISRPRLQRLLDGQAGLTPFGALRGCTQCVPGCCCSSLRWSRCWPARIRAAPDATTPSRPPSSPFGLSPTRLPLYNPEASFYALKGRGSGGCGSSSRTSRGPGRGVPPARGSTRLPAGHARRHSDRGGRLGPDHRPGGGSRRAAVRARAHRAAVRSADKPAELKIHYDHADDDLDDDGDVDGEDDDIESTLSIWRQESPGDPFVRLGSVLEGPRGGRRRARRASAGTPSPTEETLAAMVAPFADDATHQLRELVRAGRFRERSTGIGREEGDARGPRPDAQLLAATAATRLGSSRRVRARRRGARSVRAPGAISTAGCGRSTCSASSAFELGHLARGRGLPGEALDLAHRLQDSLMAARACNNLASVAPSPGPPGRGGRSLPWRSAELPAPRRPPRHCGDLPQPRPDLPSARRVRRGRRRRPTRRCATPSSSGSRR